jgi:hypothetical protein
MPEQIKELDPFKPEEPTIPGVTGKQEQKKPFTQPQRSASPPSAPAQPGSVRTISPRLWLAVVAVVIALVSLGIHLVKRPASSHPAQASAATALPEPVSAKAPPAPPPMPFGPGPIATTSELDRPWSSKRFIFRAPQDSEELPAMVVKLPGGDYWAVSMREPYGTCELQYVRDPAALATNYHFTATHPMLADPCSRAVFDLLQYAPGPVGVVRGAIVKGGAIRPPIANN